jgi:hypothetical protein
MVLGIEVRPTCQSPALSTQHPEIDGHNGRYVRARWPASYSACCAGIDYRMSAFP